MSRYSIFKHWIFDKNKKPLYEDSGNVLMGDINTLAKPDGQPAHLNNSPTGWRGVIIKYARNTKYLGLFRDFTVPLTFVNDGAKIIKESLWRTGFEAILYYGLSKLDQYSFPPNYEAYYTGEIDLSKFRQTRESITVTVVEGGPAKYLKAFEGTTYEIPVYDDPQAITVYLDGLPFTNHVEWTVFSEQTISGSAFSEIGMGSTVIEGTTQGILATDQFFSHSFSPVSAKNHFATAITKAFTANLTGSINVTLPSNMGVRFYVQRNTIINGAIAVQTQFNIINAVRPAGVHEFPINLSIPVNPNDVLILRGTGDLASPGIDVQINKGTIFMDYEVTFDPTFCKALKAERLAELLVAKMTDGRHTLSSYFLNALSTVVYTSGTAIRSFTDEKSLIKISFNDFYKSLQRFAVMLGTRNDQIIIEGMASAFDSTIVVDLGVVANLGIDLAEDMVYNTIKTGYKDQTYDQVNGIDEFNVTQQWTTPITKVVKELDLVSPVRADMYGIELTRLNLAGKSTTDAASDNDTFFLSVLPGATIQYYSGAFEVTGGNTIRIPRVLYSLVAGTVLNTSLGALTVTNTSFLVAGYTLVTVTPSITNGNYNGALMYDDPTVYRLNRPDYSAISGLLHPAEAFNVELSPKRALLNNARFIKSFIEDPNAEVVFQAGDKNSELSTTLDGVTITEKENIAVSTMAAPFYYPYYFQFDTEVPTNFKTLIANNPYGTIKFEDEKGNTFYGYMWDGDLKPATNDRQQWKLLCSPMTDKTLLI